MKIAVYDSGFSDLKELILQIIGQNGSNPIFSALGAFLLPMVGLSVKKFSGLNIDEFKPKEFAPSITTVPGLFIHGDEDELVAEHHTFNNFTNYGCEEKQHLVFSGTHNSERPEEVQE